MKFTNVMAAAVLAAGLSPALGLAQSAQTWSYQATIYGYFPTISGTTTFPPPVGSQSASVDMSTILDKLKFAFMGSFEASNGQWGVLADVIYVDVGGNKGQTRDFSLGNVGLPAGVSANLGYDLKGWITTVAGTYRLVSAPGANVDLIGGARVLNIRPSLNWSLTGNVGSVSVVDQTGNRESKEQNWDVIVGVKGRARLGDGAWFFPYYADVGTGESKFTWQAMGGVGYAFSWGDVVGAWRYIDYSMKSDQTVQDLSFNGPAIAAVFRW
ncbi:MAG: hypothetical protein WBA53_04060 [Burkholderiaceae bacterium]